mgnify:CR=1 FL=1
MKIDELAEKYAKIRDKVAELEAAHKEKLAPFKAAMDKIEQHMLGMFNEQGTENAKTAFGTFYKQAATSATVADKYAAMKEVYDRLLAGDWNKVRGDGSTGSGGLLFRALCIAYAQKDPADIKAFLDGKTKAEQAALRKNPKIAAIIDTLREEEAGDVDTDEMLNELDD